MNINEIKKELQSLGLPTTTPGLQGDERFEELSYRLETAKKNTHFQEQVKSEVSQSENEFVVPSLNMLSIGEIRSRLNALGESTSTPGITGEERRTVLMNRLINSICMDNDSGHINEITQVSYGTTGTCTVLILQYQLNYNCLILTIFIESSTNGS